MSRAARGARLLSLTAVVVLVATACQSPEAARRRGSGRGADVGNRDPIVQMHRGSKIYYEVPCLQPEKKCTGPMPVSGLPGDFPDRPRERTAS